MTEQPSGPTFGTSTADGPGLYNLYSALAIEPKSRNHVFNLSITRSEVAAIQPCQLPDTCADYWSSGSGGVSWPCGAFVPNLGGGAVLGILDPSCSFENRLGPGQNDCYSSFLRINKCIQTTPFESDVQVNRIFPPSWCGPTCASWDPPPIGPKTMFYPPPNRNCNPCFYNEPYGVNQPHLVVDQGLYTSQFPNRLYDIVVYWVPADTACRWPLDSMPGGTHVFCRTGTASGATWTLDANTWIHPPTQGNPVMSSPGGVLVSDSATGPPREFYGPYLAIAPNGFVYAVWLEIAPGTGLGTIWMDRSVDGGGTWGLEGSPPVQSGDFPVVTGFRTLTSLPVLSPNPGSTSVFWANSHPKIAVDPADSNSVHVVWAQIDPASSGNNFDSDIRYVSVTWPAVRTPTNPPIVGPFMQVNDPGKEAAPTPPDPTQPGAYGPKQFHPTITTDSNGAAHVFWYDNRRKWTEHQDDERYDLYGSMLRRGWPVFGGPWTTSDQRYSMCPTYVAGFPLRAFRPNFFLNRSREHFLGNYIAGPAAGAWYEDAPACPLTTENHLIASWVHAPYLNTLPPPPEPRPPHESDVFATLLKPDSLASSTNSVMRPGSVTFSLVAGTVNTARPYQLMAWLSVLGTEPGTDLADPQSGQYPAPLCPDQLINNPSSRESVIPINNFFLPNTWIQLNSGNLDACGNAQYTYPVTTQLGAGFYRVVYVLLPPPPAGATGFDFVSNQVEIRVL